MNAEVRRSDVPQLQQLGNLSKRPSDLPCPVPSTSTPLSGATFVSFPQEGATLTPAEHPAIIHCRRLAYGRRGGVLRIDGFASIDGADEFNWRLSCNRALAVATELEAPSDGSPGVRNSNLEIFAQGETTEFSTTSLASNRRVTITTTGWVPAPGPSCGLTVTGLDS